MRKTIPFERRFWAKVKRGGTDECWLWQGAKCGTHSEYGQTYLNGHKTLAHRAAWYLAYGYMPERAVEVCHSCDNPRCCNPAHLWLGTHKENMQDRDRKKRANPPKGSTHNWAKLTEQDILLIHDLLQQGVTQHSIARQLGVTQPAISKIKNRENWKHIEAA